MKSTALFALMCGSLFGSMPAIAAPGEDRPATAASQSKGTVVGIVDLDKAATDLGYTAALAKKIDAYQAQLRGELKKYDSSYSAQINAYVRSLVPRTGPDVPGSKINLTPQQQAQVSELVNSARTQLAALGQQGDQDFSMYRLSLIKEYRRQLTPIVQAVARQKKVDLVLIQGDNVLATDTTIDLTRDVVDAAKANPPTIGDVEMKHLTGPEQIPQATTAPSTQPAK